MSLYGKNLLIYNLWQYCLPLSIIHQYLFVTDLRGRFEPIKISIHQSVEKHIQILIRSISRLEFYVNFSFRL
jgi:hypothetical protein